MQNVLINKYLHHRALLKILSKKELGIRISFKEFIKFKGKLCAAYKYK